MKILGIFAFFASMASSYVAFGALKVYGFHSFDKVLGPKFSFQLCVIFALLSALLSLGSFIITAKLRKREISPNLALLAGLSTSFALLCLEALTSSVAGLPVFLFQLSVIILVPLIFVQEFARERVAQTPN
jgi:ABC-type Fe3+-siderophore transport system permease subunit